MLGLGLHAGRHLGDRAGALVDDQLSPDEAARAWAHVESCTPCAQEVQRQSWLKSRLSAFSAPAADPAPDAGLLGALYDVDARTRTAWQETDAIEARSRRRTLTLVGAGSVSAAVLGVLALTGSPAGQGERLPVRPAPARMSAVLAGVGSQPSARPSTTPSTPVSQGRSAVPTSGPGAADLSGPAH